VDALGLGLAALVLYWLFGQHTLYGDGFNYMLLLRHGETRHVQHVAYLPIVHGCLWLLGPIGFTTYEAALSVSQGGAAVGVACSYLAARGYGARRERALLVAAGVALAPGILFFATLVELQGPFVGASSLAWLFGAVLARRPSLTAAVLVGVGTALATAVHTSGVLLVGPVLAVALLPVFPRHAALTPGRRLTLALTACAVHVALVFAAGGARQFAGAAKFAAITAELHKSVAGVVAWEWLLPFFPASVAFLLALARPQWRRAAAFTLAGVAAYLLPTYWVLAYWHECGAYLIPLAFPALMCTAHVLRPRWCAVAIALGAALGLGSVVHHDRPERSRAYAAGVRAILACAPGRLLGAGIEDLEASCVALDDVPLVLLSYPPFLDAGSLPAILAVIDRGLEDDWRGGRKVLLTAGAERRLQGTDADRFPTLPAIWQHLRDHYRLEPVSRLGFSGHIVLGRAEPAPVGR